MTRRAALLCLALLGCGPPSTLPAARAARTPVAPPVAPAALLPAALPWGAAGPTYSGWGRYVVVQDAGVVAVVDPSDGAIVALRSWAISSEDQEITVVASTERALVLGEFSGGARFGTYVWDVTSDRVVFVDETGWPSSPSTSVAPGLEHVAFAWRDGDRDAVRLVRIATGEARVTTEARDASVEGEDLRWASFLDAGHLMVHGGATWQVRRLPELEVVASGTEVARVGPTGRFFVLADDRVVLHGPDGARLRAGAAPLRALRPGWSHDGHWIVMRGDGVTSLLDGETLAERARLPLELGAVWDGLATTALGPPERVDLRTGARGALPRGYLLGPGGQWIGRGDPPPLIDLASGVELALPAAGRMALLRVEAIRWGAEHALVVSRRLGDDVFTPAVFGGAPAGAPSTAPPEPEGDVRLTGEALHAAPREGEPTVVPLPAPFLERAEEASWPPTLARSPDGRWVLVSIATRPGVLLLDLDGAPVWRTLSTRAGALSNDALVVCEGEDLIALALEGDARRRVAACPEVMEHMTVSPDGRFLAGSQGSRVHLVRLADGAHVYLGHDTASGEEEWADPGLPYALADDGRFAARPEVAAQLRYRPPGPLASSRLEPAADHPRLTPDLLERFYRGD